VRALVEQKAAEAKRGRDGRTHQQPRRKPTKKTPTRRRRTHTGAHALQHAPSRPLPLSLSSLLSRALRSAPPTPLFTPNSLFRLAGSRLRAPRSLPSPSLPSPRAHIIRTGRLGPRADGLALAGLGFGRSDGQSAGRRRGTPAALLRSRPRPRARASERGARVHSTPEGAPWCCSASRGRTAAGTPPSAAASPGEYPVPKVLLFLIPFVCPPRLGGFGFAAAEGVFVCNACSLVSARVCCGRRWREYPMALVGTEFQVVFDLAPGVYQVGFAASYCSDSAPALIGSSSPHRARNCSRYYLVVCSVARPAGSRLASLCVELSLLPCTVAVPVTVTCLLLSMFFYRNCACLVT
jgi:hypothetical protein